MLHCKTNNRTRLRCVTTFYFLHFNSSKWYFVFWPGEWLYKTDFIDYYRNLARFIESSAGKNQRLFYA